MGTWKSKNRHKYLLQYQKNFSSLLFFVCKYRKKLLISERISDDIKQFSYDICQKHNVIIRYMETDKEHIHYMIETEPTMSVSKIENLMKSCTTYHIWKRYPDYLQKEQIAKTFGCCRFVYNQTLAYRKEACEKEKKSVSKTDCNNYCNRKLKQMKAKLHRDFIGQIKSATVSQAPSGKYYVSILVETVHDALPEGKGRIGLDLGIKDLYTTSGGQKYKKPKILAKWENLEGNRTIYHIDHVIRETGVTVDNGLHTVCVNTKIDDGTDIAELMKCFMQTEVDNDKFPAVSKRMKYLKHSEGGLEKMCKIMEEYVEERIESHTDEQIEQALAKGKNPQDIADYIGVSVERVMEVQERKTVLV